MKIVSWNVNGLKAVIKNRQTSLKGFLDHFNADVICIQETKATRSLMSIDIAICEGYTGYFSFCKSKQGYSGVATFCRSSVTPVAAEEGITGCSQLLVNDGIGFPADLPHLTEEESTALDTEGRAVITEHLGEGGVITVIINLYCPRVDPESSDRLPYKLNFFTSIRERCKALIKTGRQVIVCGDFNCSREVIDSATLEEMPTFPRETETRELLSSFVGSGLDLKSSGLKPILIDSFRFMHPEQRAAYTCWCTKTDSRKLNYGQRLDYIFVTPSLVESLLDTEVLQDEQGSDHCPVTCTLALTLTSARNIPSFSSNHFPEFAGRQSKLSAYFGTKTPSEQVKRKLSEPSNSRKKSKIDNQQATMLSLWNPKEKNGLTNNFSSRDKTLSSTEPSPTSIVSSSTTGLSTEWKGVFKAPPKVPLCPGHKEPAVQRTVKKNGPNKNRKFYVCGRPDGAKSDPEARCDFFQWAK